MCVYEKTDIKKGNQSNVKCLRLVCTILIYKVDVVAAERRRSAKKSLPTS